MSRLILSRNIVQSLVIDGRITVTIVSNKAGKVKLAVDAPLDVEVHRTEVWEGLQEAAMSAVEVDGSTSFMEVTQ